MVLRAPAITFLFTVVQALVGIYPIVRQQSDILHLHQRTKLTELQQNIFIKQYEKKS